MTPRATLRAAVAQMCSADNHAENIATVTDLAAQAASAGADLLCLPEVAGLMNRNAAVARAQVVTEADDDGREDGEHRQQAKQRAPPFFLQA